MNDNAALRSCLKEESNESSRSFQQRLSEAIEASLAYCRASGWAGYDPYDGLNSRLFARTPFMQSRYFRLALIQGLKRFPINLRPLLRVPKEQNPKGIALFAVALIKCARMGGAPEEEAERLLDRLVESRSEGWDCTCWGYHFDWQTRTYLVPKFTPNIICTTFAGNALLDGYQFCGRETFLEHAISAGQFLTTALNRTSGRAGFCFSYTPLDHSRIHNANLLGAAFLARLHDLTGREELLGAASDAARFSVGGQEEDGAWRYGEGRHQHWIDSFHTGYNLVALERLRQFLPESKWIEASLRKGFDFFLQHFFQDGSVVKYYHDRVFPIDIHAIAQAIITLIELRRYDPAAVKLAERVCAWALANMRQANGAFIYQRHRFFTNRIAYIRWGQAWMLLAMVSLAETLRESS